MTKNPSAFLTIESRLFSWIFALLLLLGFPLALLAPQGLAMESQWLLKWLGNEKLAYNAFQFKIPAIAIASYLSLALMISRMSFNKLRQHEKKGLIFAGIFALLTLISAWLHKSGPFETLTVLAFVFIPLGISQLAQKNTLLPRFFGLYYFLNLTYFYLLSSPTGIAANKNWLIASLLATSPWAVTFLRQVLYQAFRFLPKHFRNSTSTLLSFLFVWTCTLLSLNRLNSRAAWLAFGLVLAYLIFRGSSKLFKKTLIFAFVFASIFGVIYAKKNFSTLTHNELRPPLWKGTAKMIESAPLLGRSGPGQFSNAFPNYRLAEQLMLPISAPNSSHPHNELLKLASEVGLPACLALLCFFLLILKAPGRKNASALHCVLVLSTCAMFDKLLIENATALLFLFSMGLLIPVTKHKSTAKKTLAIRKALGFIIILFGTFIAINQTQASWFHRHGFNDQSAALVSFDAEQKKTYWQKSFASYAKAVAKDPNNTRYNYHALNAALMGLQDDAKATPYLSTMLKRAPNYINTNRLLAYYQELRYIKSSDPDKKAHALQLALKANAKELQINGARLSNISDGLLFALRHQNIPLAIQTQKLYKQQSLRLAQYLFQDELSETLQSWHKAIEQNQAEQALQLANSLHQIKGLNYIDPFYIRTAPKEFKQRQILDPKKFTQADFIYWRELIALRQDIGKENSHYLGYCQKKLKSIQVKEGLAYSSPHETLLKAEASRIALLSFFAQSATAIGRPHLILEDSQGQAFIIIQDGLNSILINAKKASVHSLPHQEIITMIRKQKFKTSFFSSPQAFFSANTYLFSLYNSQFKEQSISLNTPSLNWMISKQVLGKKAFPKIRTESFFHLTQKHKDF